MHDGLVVPNPDVAKSTWTEFTAASRYTANTQKCQEALKLREVVMIKHTLLDVAGIAAAQLWSEFFTPTSSSSKQKLSKSQSATGSNAIHIVPSVCSHSS